MAIAFYQSGPSHLLLGYRLLYHLSSPEYGLDAFHTKLFLANLVPIVVNPSLAGSEAKG